MCLQAVRQCFEDACVSDLSVGEATREIGDLVGDREPHAVLFICWSVGRSWDDVPFNDQRIQVDHLGEVVEKVDHHLPGDAGRQRAYRSHRGPFGHGLKSPHLAGEGGLERSPDQ